jgi:hypothetical protein
MLTCFSLRKGKVLRRVDAMTANEGFFELQADDNKDLLHIPKNTSIDNIKKKITSCMCAKNTAKLLNSIGFV